MDQAHQHHSIKNSSYLVRKFLLVRIVFSRWDVQNYQKMMTLAKIWVKVTLRSAARPRRALARHSAGTCISSWTLQSQLCFTPITLVIHLFLSHSHLFHLWVTWSVRCPVNASQLTCQGLGTSFYKAFTNSLVFCKGIIPILVPLISFQCLSFHSVVSSQTFSGHFPRLKPIVSSMTEQRRPTLMPSAVILLPISVPGKTTDYFLRVLHFICCHIGQSILYV